MSARTIASTCVPCRLRRHCQQAVWIFLAQAIFFAVLAVGRPIFAVTVLAHLCFALCFSCLSRKVSAHCQCRELAVHAESMETYR